MVSEYNLGLLAAIEVANNIDKNESIPEMISLINVNLLHWSNLQQT